MGTVVSLPIVFGAAGTDTGAVADVYVLPARAQAQVAASPTGRSDEIAKRQPSPPVRRRRQQRKQLPPVRRFDDDDDDTAEPIGPGQTDD